MSKMERALFVAASHCQGGHSEAGAMIADVFGFEFPVSMDKLRKAAEARGYNAAELWPWWVKQRPDLFADGALQPLSERTTGNDTPPNPSDLGQ